MKKCKKCGAVQSDDRNTCLDCGAVLGKPVSAEEEARMEDEFSDTLYGMSERTEDFYVSPLERFLGIFSILAAVALIVMLNVIGMWNDALEKQEIAAEGYLSYQIGNSGTVYYVTEDGVSGVVTGGDTGAVGRALENAGIASLFGIVCYAGAALFFLCPKFLWQMETLKHRMWYHGDITPSDFALISYKVMQYLFFAAGCIAAIAVIVYLV